jgi:hypothetical protein
VRSKDPSPLTVDERQLLEGFLAHEFPGVEALRAQAAEVHARKGCDCGCGTIDVIPIGAELPRSDATSPVRVEGIVLDADGAEVGGLLLFVTDGLLASLEVYAYDQPLPLPTIDRVRWNP